MVCEFEDKGGYTRTVEGTMRESGGFLAAVVVALVLALTPVVAVTEEGNKEKQWEDKE